MDTVAVNAALDALGRLPGWLIWGWFWSKVLDMRGGDRLHWVLWTALWLLQSVRMPAMGTGSPESVLYFAVQCVAYPLLMSRDGLWYRVFVLALTTIASIAVELLAVLTALACGIVMPSDFRDVLDHPLAYALCMVFITLLLAFSFSMLYIILARISHRRANPVPRFFGPALLAQFGMIAAMVAVAEYFAWGNGVVLLAACLFALVNIAADAFILMSAFCANAAWEQRLRSKRLRSRLDAALGHFRGLAGEVQAVARFRHDLRDELQTVAALVRRGDYVRAEALVDELQGRLDGSRGPAREDGA